MKLSLSLFERAASTPSIPSTPAISGRVLRSAQVQPHHAALIRDINRRMMRMYEAAVVDRLSADFPISLASANAEILVSAIAARSRARRVERDNPYAWGMLNTFQNNVVGEDPFRLEMKVGQRTPEGEFIEERETNQIIEEWWAEAGLPENFTVRRDMSRLEAYLQACTALVRDGGILWQKYRGFPKNIFRYAIEPIEVDRLDHNYNRPAVGTNNEIQFGIEMDEYHGVIAYWILSRHPGDVFAWSSSPRYRVPIAADDIIALWDIRTRAGQYVAMPRFSSIIQRLHRIDQYDIAEITAAIWASCKPFFLKRNAGEQRYEGDEKSKAGESVTVTEPATGEILPDGYSVDLVDPKHPTDAYPYFTKTNLRAVGAGAGIAYHTLANDLEGVNFSSGRLGENAQRDEFKKLQAHMILSLVRPDFNERLKYAILSGELKLPVGRLKEFQRAAIFHAKRWPYVNPLQDAQADILRIEAGLDSRQHVIAESDRGGTFEDVCAEQGSDNQVAELHKLDFAGEDPTTPTVSKGAPGEEKPVPDDGDAPAPPAKTGGKQTIKKSRVNKSRLDRTLAVLAVTGDPKNGKH